MNWNRRMTGDLIQAVGVLMLGAGVTCEIILGGDIHFVVITIGAVVFTIGTMIKGA